MHCRNVLNIYVLFCFDIRFKCAQASARPTLQYLADTEIQIHVINKDRPKWNNNVLSIDIPVIPLQLISVSQSLQMSMQFLLYHHCLYPFISVCQCLLARVSLFMCVKSNNVPRNKLKDNKECQDSSRSSVIIYIYRPAYNGSKSYQCSHMYFITSIIHLYTPIISHGTVSYDVYS